MSTQINEIKAATEVNSEFSKNFSKNIAKFIPWLFENYQVKNVYTGVYASQNDVNISNFAEPKRKKMESLFKFIIDSDFTVCKNEVLIDNENEVISDFNNASKKPKKVKSDQTEVVSTTKTVKTKKVKSDKIESGCESDQTEVVTKTVKTKKVKSDKIESGCESDQTEVVPTSKKTKTVKKGDKIDNGCESDPTEVVPTSKKTKTVKKGEPNSVKPKTKTVKKGEPKTVKPKNIETQELENLNIGLNALFGNPLKTKTNTEYSNEWQIQIGKDIFTICQSKNDKETVYIKKTVVSTLDLDLDTEQPDMEQLFGEEERCCEEENVIERCCEEENVIERCCEEENVIEKLYDEISLDDIEF
jgi:hypothetical protein